MSKMVFLPISVGGGLLAGFAVALLIEGALFSVISRDSQGAGGRRCYAWSQIEEAGRTRKDRAPGGRFPWSTSNALDFGV
jgi:hypothetical protein